MQGKIDENFKVYLLLHAKHPGDCSTYARKTQEFWHLLESHREKICDTETSPVCIDRAQDCSSAVILISSG